MRRLALAALAAAALSASALAADDAADIAFWTSVRNSAEPAELRAYIEAFPDGHFVGLARLRLRALTPPASAATAPTAGLPVAAPVPAATVSVAPTQTRLRLVDPVVVDVDARGLASGSNHRLIVVAAGTPEAIADRAAFARDSTTIPPSRTRVSLPTAGAGRNEIRLYYVPQFGEQFVLAARSGIEVAPGYPGAVLVGSLVRQAAEMNPIRFEALYRDRTVTVQGQFLRVQPRMADPLGWASLLGVANPQHAYVAMFVGRLGTERRADGGPTELLCLMPAEDRQVLDRLALLERGDPVVLQGTPSTWQSVFGSTAVIFNPCAFAPAG